MAPVQSVHSLSGSHPTADSEPTTSCRKNYKTPISSSSNFKPPHHPTTTAVASVCSLTLSQTTRITRQFDHSLIAWTVGKKIRPGLLAFRLRRLLHIVGDLFIFELGLGFFVLQFSNSLDYYKALEERPWSIPSFCIHVFPWIPNFKPSVASIQSVDVWIRLPELSLEYYDEEVFKKIAETIGVCLVKIDPVTERREKCLFARICVRITLCNPLVYNIKFGSIEQKIEYEGLDSLCPVCGCVDDLKHHCLNNPSGYDSRKDSPRLPLQASDPSSSSGSGSKGPLIHSLSSSESASESKSQEKDTFLELKLKDCPRLEIGKCKPHTLMKAKEVEKQTLPNFPKESSTTIMKAPESKRTNLIQSLPSAPSVVVDQSIVTKASSPTTLPIRNNESQSSSAVDAGLKFFSTVIQQSTTEKEMTNTPCGGTDVVDSWPTVYTIASTTTSLGIDLSEVPTAPGSNQKQYATKFVMTSSGQNENEVDSEGVSMASKKMLCWNFHGTDKEKLMRALKDLIQRYEPSIVLIFGSKISSADADVIVRKLTLDSSYCRKPDGYNGGVWMLLSRQDVQIEVSSYSYSPHKVSASVHFHSKTSQRPWGPTFFYASTRLMDNTMAC